MVTQLGLRTGSLSYKHFFGQHYESVCQLAMHITEHDRDLSEEIVHDTYIKLHDRLVSPEMRSIEAYLFVALKNSYISKVRKKASRVQFVVPEMELISEAPRFSGPEHALDIRDRLRAICDYACTRKESSISGGIIILRFFHGYFPHEVEKVVKRKKNAIEARLAAARREITNFFECPEKYLQHEGEASFAKPDSPGSESDLISELREKIFSSRSSRCPSEEQVFAAYSADSRPLGKEMLNHFVSCRDCLESVNRLIGIAPLAERHPLDTIRAKFEPASSNPPEIKVMRAAA